MTTLNFQARVPVFDANIGVGHLRNRASPFESPEQLLREMDRHGVARVWGLEIRAAKNPSAANRASR